MVFSAEKRFSLNEADGLPYYWHDLRREKKTGMSHQMGGGPVMVRGSFFANGKSAVSLQEI